MDTYDIASIARALVSDLDIRGGTWVRARDPKSPDAANLASKFAGHQPQTILQTAYRMFDSEGSVPSPHRILEKLHAESATSTAKLVDPLDCKHPEPWGFTIEGDGTRLAFCRYCYSEWEAPNVRAASEVADLEEARRGY